MGSSSMVSPGAGGSPRGRRTLAWIVAGGTALALALVALKDPAAGGYPTCAIRDWTGLECASCGGLRAAHETLHGRLGSAWGLNPLALIAIPAAVLLLISEVRVGLGHSALRTGIRRGHWMWIVPAALLVFMVLRNLL